jgi:hypothetical protein
MFPKETLNFGFIVFIFRAPKKKLLKFLSNLKEDTKNGDSLIKLSAKGTAREIAAIAEEGIPADSRVAGLKSRDSSGNVALKLLT